jgi:antitoxin PrlF
MESTLTYKGQITIPASIRKKLNLHSGDKVDFIYISENKAELVVKNHNASDLKGVLKKPNFTATVEEMNKTIEETL